MNKKIAKVDNEIKEKLCERITHQFVVLLRKKITICLYLFEVKDQTSLKTCLSETL